KGKYDPTLLRTIDWMLTIDEAQRPVSVKAVREALAAHLCPSLPSQEPPGVTITGSGAGQAILTFDQPIDADLLELAFFVDPPGQYLAPSGGDTPNWSTEPHYFSLDRAGGATAPFTVGADIVARISAGTQVTLSSSDGFINASATWPKLNASRSRASQWLIAASVLIAAGLAAAGYSYYTIQQHNSQSERELLTQQLQQAGLTRDALQQLLNSCGNACPNDIKAQVQSRLNLIDAEERTYQAAHNDSDKLRAYLGTCQACDF